MSAPKISVLLPFFNSAEVLERCLESIVQQSFRDFEIIAVDDGSTDKGPRILASILHTEPRLRILRAPRRGLIAALNIGLNQARGEFVARMDADDVMHPDRLTRQIEYMRAHPRVDVLGTLVQAGLSDDAAAGRTWPYLEWSNEHISHEEIEKAIFIDAPIVHPTFFVRREFYRAMGGYQDNGWAEDYDFLLRASGRGARFAKVNAVLLTKYETERSHSWQAERYKRPAVMKARVHYLLQRRAGSTTAGYVLIGSGGAARSIAENLLEREADVLGFLDNISGPPDRSIMGLPARTFTPDKPAEALREYPGAYYILAVGDKQAAAVIEASLEQAGYNSPDNFIRFV